TRSFVDPNADENSEPPAEYRERGWRWPRRVASESFVPYGTFGTPEEPLARLAGTVIRAEVRTNSHTNQRFVAARIDAIVLETTVCCPFADGDECPQPGNIVEGSVFLVGSLCMAPQIDQGTASSPIRQ